MEWIKSVKSFYTKSKRIIVYVDLLLVVIVFYAGKYLGNMRDTLLPGAIAGAFAILLETLFSINSSLQNKEDMHIYNNLNLSYPKMMEVLNKGNPSKHLVKIIAAPGGTTVNAFMSQMISESKVPIIFELLLLDSKSNFMNVLPPHWPAESQASLAQIKKIGEFEKNKCIINCYLYNYIPCVRGFLIDDKYLFIGHFIWEKNGESIDLKGSTSTHVFYNRQLEYEHNFKLFESWFNYAPRQLIYSNEKKPT